MQQSALISWEERYFRASWPEVRECHVVPTSWQLGQVVCLQPNYTLCFAMILLFPVRVCLHMMKYSLPGLSWRPPWVGSFSYHSTQACCHELKIFLIDCLNLSIKGNKAHFLLARQSAMLFLTLYDNFLRCPGLCEMYEYHPQPIQNC